MNDEKKTQLGSHGSFFFLAFGPDHHDPMIRIIWSHDLDQKKGTFFLIRIKKCPCFFWSGSKSGAIFFDPDQKCAEFFLIRIKNCIDFFWSGSKISPPYFDPKFSKTMIQKWSWSKIDHMIKTNDPLWKWSKKWSNEWSSFKIMWSKIIS